MTSISGESSAGYSDAHIFPVDLIQSPPKSRLAVLHGSYHLQLLHDGIRLLDKKTGCQVSYWPLSGIRRFVSKTERFVIVAGKRCESGEGEFVFRTSLSSNIHKTCMSLIRNQIQ